MRQKKSFFRFWETSKLAESTSGVEKIANLLLNARKETTAAPNLTRKPRRLTRRVVLTRTRGARVASGVGGIAVRADREAHLQQLLRCLRHSGRLLDVVIGSGLGSVWTHFWVHRAQRDQLSASDSGPAAAMGNRRSCNFVKQLLSCKIDRHSSRRKPAQDPG